MKTFDGTWCAVALAILWVTILVILWFVGWLRRQPSMEDLIENHRRQERERRIRQEALAAMVRSGQIK